MKTKMNITIDRKFTDKLVLESIRNDVKEFKVIYTADDLLRFFGEETGNVIHGTIILANLSAFNDGTGHASYMVDLVVDGYGRITKVHFYVDQNGKIAEDELLRKVEVYRLS